MQFVMFLKPFSPNSNRPYFWERWNKDLKLHFCAEETNESENTP